MTRLIAYKLFYAFAGMASMSAILIGMFAVMTGAAWFALGSDMPPVPWFLIRFFLFIGWAIAGIGGLCMPVPQNTDVAHDH